MVVMVVMVAMRKKTIASRFSVIDSITAATTTAEAAAEWGVFWKAASARAKQEELAPPGHHQPAPHAASGSGGNSGSGGGGSGLVASASATAAAFAPTSAAPPGVGVGSGKVTAP